MNAAKLAITLVFPEDARPAAMPTRLLSAIPMLKNRSGNFLPNHSVLVELLTSASTTTTSACSEPSASSARPNASRVALPSSRLVVTADEAPAIFDRLSSFDSFTARRNFGQRVCEVFFRQRLSVEIRIAELAQHVQDSLSLVRETDDAAWLALHGAGPLQGLDDLAHVVTVDRLRF